MASFLHQLKVLLWKNWLSVYRQPVWSVVLILWPVVIFFILAMTRIKYPPTQVPDCYLAPRNLQSTGMIPFLQNFLCDSDASCASKSFIPNTSSSRLQKRSVDSSGGGSIFQMRSSNDQLATMWDSKAGENWGDILNNITVVKTALEELSSGDAKGALCTTITLLPVSQQSPFQNFCNSDQTLASFVLEALFSQASGSDILTTIQIIATQIEKVQNNTAIWNILLLLPELIKNPSLIYEGDLYLFFTDIIPEIADLHLCVKYIVKTANQVQNQSATNNPLGILEIVLDQSMKSELKSCISMFQRVPCGSSQCWLEMEQTFKNIYWLMLSLTNGTSNNVCEFNGLNVTCNGTFTQDEFLQSVLEVLNEIRSNSSTVIIRYVQRAWIFLKQGRVDEIILQQIEEEINKRYPSNPQMQTVLTQLIHLLFNTIDILVTESNTGVLQNFLDQIKVLVGSELLNSTDIISNLTQSIVKEVQYLMNLSGLLSTSNVSSQTLGELQNLVNSLSTINSEIFPLNSTTLFKILAVINQPVFRELQQTLQTLLNLNPIASNIPATVIHAFNLFGELMSTSSFTNNSVLVDVYIKEILQFLNTDSALVNDLAFLNSYFNFTQLDFIQSEAFKNYAGNILSFFTPSNLQGISSNPNNVSSELLKLISSFIPTEEKETFDKVESIFSTLLDLVSICQTEFSNCTRYIFVFQQQLSDIMQYINNFNSGNIQDIFDSNITLKFVNLSNAEIAIVNTMLQMISCSQAHENVSCTTTQDFYNTIIGQVSSIQNMSLGSDSNLVSTLPILVQLKQNVNNIFQVLGSVDVTKLASQLDNITRLSKCYMNTPVNPMQCTMEFSLSLVDYLRMLPFPEPTYDTLLVASSIVKQWLGTINGTTDIYQQFAYLYNLSSMTFHNHFTLMEIHKNLLYIVQHLEELRGNLKLTSIATDKWIGDLLETLTFANISYAIPTPLLLQTTQELEMIKTQLQTIEWYIVFVKNETDAFQTTGNIDALVTMAQLIISNALTSIKRIPSLVPIADEMLNVMNWLQNSEIIPALQSIQNNTLQNGGQGLETLINHTVSVIEMIIEKELVNGTLWNPILSDITESDITFVVRLLQEYDNERLANLSSVLLFTEKVLLAMETVVNDLHLETAFNHNLQTVHNISQEVIRILYNAEHNTSINKNVLYDIYNLLLEGWNGSIFNELPMLKKSLMDLLYLSMQCLSESTDSSPSQNCSAIDIINVTQLILRELNNQTPLYFNNTEGNITMNNVLEYVLSSIWQVNISTANPEIAITEELACLTKMLNVTLQLVSRVNDHLNLNTTWIPEMDRALVEITEKFSTFNVTCNAIDKKMVTVIYQLFENQSNLLQSLVPLVSNQTSYSPIPSQYLEDIDEIFNIIKLYAATQGHISLNNTLVNLWNETLLQIFETNLSSSEWLQASEILKMLSNVSTYIGTIEGSKEFSAIISRVADLTVASLHLNTSLTHVSLANIFENNFSTLMFNLIKLVSLERNVTSIESCENTFVTFITFYQSNMNLSLSEPFYSNMSSWTCSMLFTNISASDWLEELKAMTDMMVSLEPGVQTNATMKIISSFIQFVTFTNADTFENFVTSMTEIFIGKDLQSNSIVFQTLDDLMTSLQPIVTEIISSENSNSTSTVEISSQAMEAVNVFLKSLNITGYDRIFAFASDILQVYFNFKNSTLPMENLAQKILGQILTSFQVGGLQNVFIQSVQSQILGLSSEEQIVANFLNIVVSAINETISALQPPSYNNNLVFNIIVNIVKNFNRTYVMERLGGNKNITELIFSLVTEILQIAQNGDNVPLAIVFPQNGTNEAVNDLESLLNHLLSQNSADEELFYKYSTTLLNVFAASFAEGEKAQVMQTIQYVLNLSNGTINVPVLVNTLENFYDLLNLNKTVDWNILELFIKQLSSFISISQINQTLSDFSFLFNTSQKLSSLQTSEIRNAALELLPFFYPSSLYNISKGSDSLVSTLLNILSKNIPLDQQHTIRNITDTILSLIELTDNCRNDSTACDRAVSGFEVLAINVVNVITTMENGTFNLEISNQTLHELEKLTNFEISLINNIFSLFWNMQNTTNNLSGDLQNVYQDILSASQLILNITKDLNASTVQSDLETLKNYTQWIGIIQKVASANNVTEKFLQIMSLQKDFQCSNQTLLCMVNLTSQFLGFLQTLQVPQPLMEQVLAASSIVEYWLGEINTTADVYQQMVSLYGLTSAALQNEPTLQSILLALTNISKIIQDMKMNNTSFFIVEDLLSNIFIVLQKDNLLNSSTSPLHINSTQLENVQTQIKIIEWYIMHIKNQTENYNMSGDPYALYRLIQISLVDVMASVQNWLEFANMSNLSSHEIENLIQLLRQILTTNDTGAMSQLENLSHLSDIFNEISSIQGLEFSTIWQVISRLMVGELNMTQIDEIVKVVQAAITTHNITEGTDFVQLYNFFFGIINQIYSTGNMSLTQFFHSSLDSFLAMDCQSVSKYIAAVYKMTLNNTNQTSPWVDEMFFSNFTLDVCGLLHWNNSQDDWLTLLQTSRKLISYVIPLVSDSMSKYFNAAEYILGVAADFLAEPDLTQRNIMNILNVAPAINELFNTSAMDWVQNVTFQKLAYFLLDLAWTSSSPKEVLLLKVQNFTFIMVQDIQDLLKAQPVSLYNAWVSFALEVVKTIMNETQYPSSEERLLKQVWDSFKQNSLEALIISTVSDLILNNSSAISENEKLLDYLLQLVFNITDSVISDAPLNLSNASTNTTIRVLQLALSGIMQAFLPQYKNSTLEQGVLQTGMDMTMIFSELQLVLNSIITNQTNTTNIEANLFSLISVFAQNLPGSNDTQYIKLFLDAQKIFNEFAQINTTITVQNLSAIFANYLPNYVGANNETQASLYIILNMWQYLNNLTNAQSNNLSSSSVSMLPIFQSLLNESTKVSELMSWLVNFVSGHIPPAEQDVFHKAANATQHLIDAVQTCCVNMLTCPNLIEGVQIFISDVTQLETFMQNRSLANSSLLHFGLYNQSQITLINDIFLLLSYAMGLPYNASSSQNGVYEYVLTLQDWIFNTTMEDNLNFTTTLSPQNIIDVLNSMNITEVLLQVENVLQTSTYANHTDKDELLCKFNVTLQLTQLLNQLPFAHTIQGNLSVISSILGQWIISINTDISIYQQLIELYNVTALTLQHQPILQAVNTSLVNIVHMLHDMGVLQNISMNETDIVTEILLGIIQQIESGPNIYNLSSVLQYNISELLQSMQLQLDIVNWLMLHLENHTGIFANSSENHTVAQWMINNYPQINIIIRDVVSVVKSFDLLSPNATIDALTMLVEDLLSAFPPQTGDEHLIETLQIVQNVTRILLEVTGPNMINQINMFINSFNTLTFQSDISKDPTKLLDLFSFINQTGLISKIGTFIKSFIVSNDMQIIKQFLDALKMFNHFTQMNNTINIQDLSAILVKYLHIYPETANDVQTSLNTIFNLWQYLNNLTNAQPGDPSNTAMQILPFLESHLLLNENNNISQIMSWLVNIISRHVPPEELDRFINAANASLLVIEAMEACVGKPVTCKDLIRGVQIFLADITHIETFVRNGTLANNSLLQFVSYNQSQTVLINKLFMMLSYAMGHSYNTSTSQSGVCEDILTLKNMLLNTTMEDELNLTIPLYLQSLSEVLISADISQILLQVESLLNIYTCTNQTEVEPFLCKLNMTLQITQFLNQLPLSQTTHDHISIISSIVRQWLSYLNENMSTYQQLIELYNVTVLAFDHQSTIQAINESLINITYILRDIGILQNVSLYKTDIALNILSEMIQLFNSGPGINNLSSILKYNISGYLEAIQSQLHTIDWLMLHVFNTGIQNEQFQSLIYQIGGEIPIFTNSSWIWNLLDENIQKDAEMAWLLLQELDSANVSLILSSINQLHQTIQDIKVLNLGYTFYNNMISEKIITIIMEGMKILNNIQAKGSIAKEDIYQMYNFTYLLVQDEWTWVPFQNISAMESELLDVFYLAMTPFLGGNGSQTYIGNCTAQDVLQILIQTIFKNTTVNESTVVTTCNWQLIYNNSDATASSNHTLDAMIYLALQRSPVFHTVCSKDNLQPLSEELACLMQVMKMSMSILGELNNMSGFQISLIQSLNDSLTFICSNMPDHNFTFQTETEIMKNLETMFLNHSSPVHLLIQLIIQHYNSTIQTSDLQQTWTQISKIIKTLVLTNGAFDSHIYELIETAVNLTLQPKWLATWQNLDKILSMNWTISNIDTSLSVLEILRRAVVFTDDVMGVKALQIYQAIASLVKNPTFSLLLTNSQLVNTTVFSVAECTDVVKAVANFSSSVWSIFNQTQSNMEELLSSFGLLACNTLYVQSANYSWSLNLEIINTILSTIANYVPAEMASYFTATEKIISFLSDILKSPNISQENLLNSIYDLFIQELRMFSNTTIIADWLEKIPVHNFTSILFSSGSIATFDQVLVLETELLNLLSRSLNASSYSQGISILSHSLTYMANSISSLTKSSDISQQLSNVMTKFTVTMQMPLLTEPYGTVMNCVKNVADDLTDHHPGHLDVAIQDLFTQSNEFANGSMVPELLNQKIYQLQNLTTILCGLHGSNNTNSDCYVPCQYLTVLQEVADIATAGIKVIQKVQSLSVPTIITTILDSIFLGIESELNKMLSSVLPVSEILNITSFLSNFVNISQTSTEVQVTLGSIFHNSSHVEDQLRQVVHLSQPSVTALMSVQIPSNKTDISEWFVTLYQCSTDHSLVEESFQVFCNLSPIKGYQMAVIFLQNVDILQLSYRLFVPSTWQTIIEAITAAIKSLIKTMDEIFKDMPSIEELNNVLNIMKTLFDQNTNSTRQKRSVDLPVPPKSTRATIASFTDISRLLCSGNYRILSQALYSLYPTLTQSSTNRSSQRTQSLDQLYGLPADNPFCLNLFTNLVKTSSGASYWMLLKPVLYGQILYTPHTTETQKIMEMTNSMLLEVEKYKKTFNTLSTKIQKLVDNWKYMTQAMTVLDMFQGILNNTVVTGFLQDFLKINTTELSGKLSTGKNYIQFLIDNESYIKSGQILCQVLDGLLSCVSYNRTQPINSVNEMLAKADELQKTNELFAAVTFDLPSGTSRKERSESGLPKHIKYSITMRSLLSEDTNFIRDSYWIPGPHTTVNKYSRGFVYLQENIDRAIIEMQTNKSLNTVGVQYQPMPYPCYNKNSFLYSMSFTLPIALMISWVLFIAAFVKKLVHEKELRLHEYMKMMGINSCSHFFAWLIECAFFLIITVAILVIILKFGYVLPKSNGFLLFLFFLDYSLTVIAMSYLISVFFHNTNVAALSGSLIYIITFFPFIVVVSKEVNMSFAGKTLLSIFSPTALSYATQYIIRYEEQDEGIQWHNMYTSPTMNDTFCFGWLCWMMLIDAMIYFIIGWYIRIVFPGKYGIGSPWYFPVLPSFWMECCGLQKVFSKKASGLIISNLVADGPPEKKGDDLYPHNEQEPEDLIVGVSLHGLSKIFQSKAAVENLNLNFYEGHITSLLGHNGAGKTTTLSMLTGLFSASSGTIYVYGKDIRTHIDQARKNMGVCMQYDVLFDHLTTKEHLLLYGSTKAPQWNTRQLHEEVKRTLKDTGLYSHRHKPVKALSGGMRRKLSICIALIGGSKVVILDEPTTGVDPCSRRSIWEVISKNKKDKTIILSTHHLDEAEVMSDRIAFLEKGGLRCCGTPRFLKEKFGSGYHLTLTKKFPNQKDEKFCDSDKVTNLIHSHIPEAKLKEDVGGELVYVLPPFREEISGAYLSLLRDLDTSLNDLHIGCYGISDTTIEEVFLKLTDGLDEDDALPSRVVPITNNENVIVDDESSTNSYNLSERDDQPLTKMENVRGVKLFFKKIKAMFIKRFHNSKRNWKGLISQILLPALFVIAAMGLGSLSIGYAEYPELLLSPELYGNKEQAVVFGISNNTSEDLMNAMSSFPGIDTSCLDQNSQCLAENSLGSWNYTGNQTLTYGSCNCSTGYAVCNAPNAIPPHRMTYSRQMMYNLTENNMEGYFLTTALQFVQKRYGGWSFGIPTSQITSIEPVNENMSLSKVWYNNEGPHSLPAFLNSFSNFLLRANLPSTESSKYSISVYNKPLPGSVSQGTTATILVNTLVALSVLVGYSITTASFVTYVVKEYDNGSKRLQHIAGFGEVCYWVTNFLYDLAMYFIPVALSIAMISAFKLPAFYDYPNLGAVSLLFILFGYATFAWMYLIAGTFKNPGMAFISYVCINLFIGINTIISSSVVYMLTQQKSPTDKDFQSLNDTYNALINVFKIFPQFCFGYGLIQLSQQQAIKDQLKIYGNYEKVDIFGMDILGYMFVALTVQGTVCFILRLLINDGIIYSIKMFFRKTCMKNPSVGVNKTKEDEDVTVERQRVDSGNANRDLLLLQGLTKVFHQVKKNMIAVNNITLGIPPGECFGLLGVNGAGKTTTFKMLTGDVSPSSGNIQVRNYVGNLVNVLGFNTDWSSFGYCPQEDALDELMTGEEHLYYYARIHGIPEKRIKYATNQLLEKLQLVQYKDRITANYSCGTRRKLSTALALIGKPSILLLDEPSSGMDPKTKRQLWKIISEEVKGKCAVILTSHSMEECEALCTRLAIMVKGRFQCIGSLQHIKSRFGSGFTVKMHLQDSSVSIETITSFMHSHFPNTYLKEQHFTMAEYHVPVSAGGVASIFDLLESNKRFLNIIHFSVSQTTLDEVFINFAQLSSPDNSRESSQEVPQQVVVA